MKRLIQIAALMVVALGITLAIALYPKFSNLKAEYGTAQAIRDLEAHVRENQGQWPNSPDQLKNKYPPGVEVEINYSVTSSELIADPNKLRAAVRPRSGRFYTYPHYDWQLDNLLIVLQETNKQRTSRGRESRGSADLVALPPVGGLGFRALRAAAACARTFCEEMKPARRITFWIVALCVVVVVIFVFRPSRNIDLSGDEFPFSAIAMPPEAVGGSIFMDGGSVWVMVIDRNGAQFDFAFQHDDSGVGSAYKTAYHGAEHAAAPGAKPLKNPERAKEIALMLLKHHADFGDRYSAGVYYHLAEEEPSIGVKAFYGTLSVFD